MAAEVAGRRVVVTGAGGTIGRAFVLHLAASGARVLATDVRPDALAETQALAPGEVHELAADVTSAGETAALAAEAERLLGGVDALVNNAAIIDGLSRRPFEEIPEEEWDRVLAVNVKGVWQCARALAPGLRDARGSIVNMASAVAFSGSTGLAHYVASKAAVIGLTRVLARELGPSGVRVNALAPGFTETESTRGLVDGSYDTAATPLGRVGAPDDLLGALSFLVSDASAFVTGQCLVVDGGRILH